MLIYKLPVRMGNIFCRSNSIWKRRSSPIAIPVFDDIVSLKNGWLVLTDESSGGMEKKNQKVCAPVLRTYRLQLYHINHLTKKKMVLLLFWSGLSMENKETEGSLSARSVNFTA